ncbi:MAG: hypothetical protein A2Z31_08260 [candidate division NC10 bacterium RBG_16_65_8]|nr:MAG: hypothetical protein A2Z31_08260 [candidate division NC10 bacterium RBG_16_65_8]
MNWKHEATLGADQAAALLQAIKCNLSRSLHGEIQQAPPAVVQVWFEPLPRATLTSSQVSLPIPIVTLIGKIDVTPQTLNWTCGHPTGVLTEALSPGGRVSIRIHCGYLYDAKRRPFSAAPDAIIALESLRLPGGVFESWFFVKG